MLIRTGIQIQKLDVGMPARSCSPCSRAAPSCWLPTRGVSDPTAPWLGAAGLPLLASQPLVAHSTDPDCFPAPCKMIQLRAGSQRVLKENQASERAPNNNEKNGPWRIIFFYGFLRPAAGESLSRFCAVSPVNK